jgi:hypothetical protein
MEYSLPAWLGALAGTMIAVAVYVPAIRVIERSLRAQNAPQSPEQGPALDEKLSVVRRLILAAAIAIFATAGYWIGNALGGPKF